MKGRNGPIEYWGFQVEAEPPGDAEQPNPQAISSQGQKTVSHIYSKHIRLGQVHWLA